MATVKIYQSDTLILPLADVQHILPIYDDPESPDKRLTGIRVITKHTRWDHEANAWANDVYVEGPEAEKVLAAFLALQEEG